MSRDRDFGYAFQWIKIILELFLTNLDGKITTLNLELLDSYTSRKGIFELWILIVEIEALQAHADLTKWLSVPENMIVKEVINFYHEIIPTSSKVFINME
jgi:hypothetical protein